ncbi:MULTISPECIES: hypothetical protein [unclassified Microcoleus]|uniref:hypothetical protein n=1 Tax=unclassified Microcoleus TaxID=2642155 RepID=UPI0025EB864A|nr:MULTISPECIES: hypothetical protein [unclassified Microcoleus]
MPTTYRLRLVWERHETSSYLALPTHIPHRRSKYLKSGGLSSYARPFYYEG